VQRQVRKVALGAEVYRETDGGGTLAGSTGFSAGAVVDLSEVHHLLASFGTGRGPQHLHAYLAWQLTFGPAAP
ncbi:MAG TPA: hypothetical protein VFM45_11130, partial [Anaeromyxobacteraceae bacterium]|nr:hypothetical protein [Anaeromyxobacteraceae bacterium]